MGTSLLGSSRAALERTADGARADDATPTALTALVHDMATAARGASAVEHVLWAGVGRGPKAPPL